MVLCSFVIADQIGLACDLLFVARLEECFAQITDRLLELRVAKPRRAL
jgi:hypothetical protein